MPVALACDPASNKLFFSDWHMQHSNILSFSSVHTGDLTALNTLFNSKDFDTYQFFILR